MSVGMKIMAFLNAFLRLLIVVNFLFDVVEVLSPSSDNDYNNFIS